VSTHAVEIRYHLKKVLRLIDCIMTAMFLKCFYFR